jgi:hypothetical protein
VGLRLTKTVRGRDESLYLFMLPGVVPNPLKLSIHPTGEIHLKAKRSGLIARLDRDVLIEKVKSGSLDAPLAKFLTPKLTQGAAEGFVIPPDLFPQPRVKAGEPLLDVDFSMERLLEGMTKIELDNLADLPKALALLRSKGQLPPRTMLLLATESSDRPVMFVSLLSGPMTNAPDTLPEGLPFPKTLRSVFDCLRSYGGLLLTMPDENELFELSKVIGLGGLFDAINRFATDLDEPAVAANVRTSVEGIVAGLSVPLRAVVRAKPLRPLNSKGRSGSVSPRTRRTGRWRRPRLRTPNSGP